MSDAYYRDTASAMRKAQDAIDSMDGIVAADFIDALNGLTEEVGGILSEYELKEDRITELEGEVESFTEQLEDKNADIQDLVEQISEMSDS